MSYSFTAIGKPSAVKKAISQQIEGIKPGLASHPHEHATVCLAEEAIAAQLNFLIENQSTEIVKVSCNGSAYVAPAGITHTSHFLSIEMIHGFVE